MFAVEPGLRDHLITRAIQRSLSVLEAELKEDTALDPIEAPDRLARYMMDELRRVLGFQRVGQ